MLLKFSLVDGFDIDPSRHVRWGREEWLVSMMMWDKLKVVGMKDGDMTGLS